MERKNSVYNVTAYVNNNHYDTFFLKSIHFISAKDISQFSYNVIGTNYRFISTNLDGTRRIDTAVQFPQTSNLQLGLPYSFIGIGRSNSFVENFQIISPIYLNENPNHHQFTPIIPNSQLIISSIVQDKKLKWNLQLIVNPTDKIVTLIVIICLILVVILFFVVFLHVKEKVIEI